MTIKTRPTDWKARAPLPPAGTSTFSQQSKLPKLPVPSLAVTLDKLRASTKVLARNDAEWQACLAKIGELEKSGTTLQQRLEERAASAEHDNWLEEFWDDAAYLTYRDSVVINVSYYYGFTPHPSHLPQSPTHRAAALTRSALLFRRQLKQGLIVPDMAKDGPFCMDTWRWMFDCSRVPGVDGKDWSISHAREGDTGNDGTVIFLRKGRVWKINAAQDGTLLSTTDLERQIQYIYDHTDREYPPIGVMSASNRDIWAKDFTELSNVPGNSDIINAIHRSAFIVCLDSETPSSHIEHSRASWHGGVEGGELGNRWVDKPCQFIVWDNGKAGFMGEHSVMDGTPTVRMCNEVIDALHSTSFDHGEPIGIQTNPEPLDWKLNHSIESSIASAQKAAHALVSSQSLTFLETSYGKAAIKAFGVSPDSWAQMIIQLAYYRLLKAQGKEWEGATYEAATTRKFLKGRTETIRVSTQESMKFCENMDDKTADAQKKLLLFKEAVNKHGKDAREAGKGMGVDRHLFGLRMHIRQGEPTPKLFSDPLYQRSSRWVLSTSAIFSKYFKVYGWGEVVPDGFGVAYVTGFDDHLVFTVTSRKEMPNEEFSAELNRAADDLKALFEGTSAAKL